MLTIEIFRGFAGDRNGPLQHLNVGKEIHVQALRAPFLSRQSAHEGGKVVSLAHRPSLPIREILPILLGPKCRQ